MRRHQGRAGRRGDDGLRAGRPVSAPSRTGGMTRFSAPRSAGPWRARRHFGVRRASARTLFVAPPSALDQTPAPAAGIGRNARGYRRRRWRASHSARCSAPRRRAAPLEALLRVHDAAYIARIEAGAPSRRRTIRPRCRMSPGAYRGRAARRRRRRPRRGTRNARRRRKTPLSRRVRPAITPCPAWRWASAFSTTPPSRLVTPWRRHGAERIAIVDFDVHHGNGVQQIFWDDKNVLYCSTHQMPLYPGTGAV